MTTSEERQRIEANLSVIRQYLTTKFPGYSITEKSIQSRYHQFIVIRGTPFQRYTLKVNWSRLSNSRNTPQRTLAGLQRDFVASWMARGTDYGYYSW